MRRHTRYWRDWSSDVCSSDLTTGEVPLERLHELGDAEILEALVRVKGVGRGTAQMFLMFRLGRPDVLPRPEERRVGKECSSRCRPYHDKKNAGIVLVMLVANR